MGKVASALSMSLDGYVSGPDDSVERPLGRGGEVLFSWYANQTRMPTREHGTGDDDTDHRVASLGAVICGRVGYEVAGGWGDEPMFRCPVFVLTSIPRDPLDKAGTTFTFVTGGFEAALTLATAAAGDTNIGVHGPGVVTQAITAGVLDELRVDLVPVLLGGGRRLFDGLGRTNVEARVANVTEGDGVTHLTYRFT